MLPQVRNIPQPSSVHRRFAEALQESGFVGDIQLDFGSRLIQSTDNSIYQRLPQGVLYPAETEDLVRIARLSSEEEFQSLHFAPRGGGTGTNGQSLSDGFIVDLSRHMNRILEINAEQGWARVQAGVVKDQLNAAVKAHGLFFAPDLSTSNRATIGGMISTDASGQGSCRYGKTRHHVIAIDMVLNDGQRWSSRALADSELEQIIQKGDWIGQIHSLLDEIHRENPAAIERIFPPLNRSLTGYDLAHIRDEEGRFNLNNIICGSEGSLGFITEAVVNLEKLPSHKAVVVVRYNDFVAALRDCQHLMKAEVTAIETVDDIVLELAKGDTLWPQVAAYFPATEQSPAAINLMEITAHSADELQQQLEAVSEELARSANNPHRLGHSILEEAGAMAMMWAMRKRAVGLLGKLPGHARPLPFVEDCAVAPERLPDFIADFRKLLEREGLRFGMFGHGDAGVIHVRPAFDLRDPDSMTRIRRISDQVFSLTQRYGGILWGEHGRGLRSEYVPATFGELYPQLQRIKEAFDPRNQFNPGKIAAPPDGPALLAVDAVPTRGQRDALIPVQTWEDLPEAVYCNGNGACFNWDPDQSMCPSYKGTRERKYSPKGRATLLKEWLSQLGEQAYTVRRGPAPRTNWMAKLRPAAQDDFSHEVFDAMDTCLACKTCATGCPVQVDVPTFRSIFLSHYFSRYRRPFRHHIIAGLELLLPLAAPVRGLYNLTIQSAVGRKLAESWLGLTATPALQPARFVGNAQVEIAEAKRLMALPEAEKQRSVILVQDVFTRYLDGQVCQDIVRFLQTLGFRVWLAPGWRNGKPLHVLGFLRRFSKVATRTAKALNELAESGIPLVGLEPSMNLIYRNDYKDYLDDNVTPPPVLLLQEWLAQQHSQLAQHRDRFTPGQFKLLPHCSEAALAGKSMADWEHIFKALGSELKIEQVGCCGMAGTYGHELKYAETSQRIYELSWGQKTLDPTNTSASGYSCRSQVERFDGQRLPHPVQLLLGQLAP